MCYMNCIQLDLFENVKKNYGPGNEPCNIDFLSPPKLVIVIKLQAGAANDSCRASCHQVGLQRSAKPSEQTLLLY